MKICSKCRKSQPLSEFYVSRTSRAKDGMVNRCKTCNRSYSRERYKNNPVKKDRKKYPNRKYDLKKKFGITLEQYDVMFARQDGRCAICGGYNKSSRRLAVDHCHETGVVRGLLCSPCNTGIGHLKDSHHILQNAIDYLVRSVRLPPK